MRLRRYRLWWDLPSFYNLCRPANNANTLPQPSPYPQVRVTTTISITVAITMTIISVALTITRTKRHWQPCRGPEATSQCQAAAAILAKTLKGNTAVPNWGFPKIRGPFLSPHHKGHNILESILGHLIVGNSKLAWWVNFKKWHAAATPDMQAPIQNHPKLCTHQLAARTLRTQTTVSSGSVSDRFEQHLRLQPLLRKAHHASETLSIFRSVPYTPSEPQQQTRIANTA